MTQTLLSILIPTVVSREQQINNLLFNISKQVGVSVTMDEMGNDTNKEYHEFRYIGDLEIIAFKDAKVLTIGEKREKLYKQATGKFSIMVDDDDSISDDAIQKILEAIKSNPEIDCITFQENCLMDGKYYKSNHSLSYPNWKGDGQKELSDGFHFWRTPFYKDVIRTDIAQSVPFEKIRWGEDNIWSDAIKPLLKTEIHIDSEIYFYIHNSTDTKERYGFDRD